jgi:hypothetical protein
MINFARAVVHQLNYVLRNLKLRYISQASKLRERLKTSEMTINRILAGKMTIDPLKKNRDRLVGIENRFHDVEPAMTRWNTSKKTIMIAPRCPSCDETMKYIDEYEDYWCGRCHKYYSEKGAAGPDRFSRESEYHDRPHKIRHEQYPSESYGPPPRDQPNPKKMTAGARVFMVLGFICMILVVIATIVSGEFTDEEEYGSALEASLVGVCFSIVAIVFFIIAFIIQRRYKNKLAQYYGPPPQRPR